MQHDFFVRGAVEVRQVWGSFRRSTFRRGGGVIFGFHTELPLVVNRPRPGPPTYDLDLPVAAAVTAEARRVDFV